MTMIENFTNTEHKHEFEPNDPRKFYTLYSAGEDYGGTPYKATWSRTGRPAASVDHGAPTDHEVVHATPRSPAVDLVRTKSSTSISRVASRYQPEVWGSWVTMSPASLWK